MDRSKSAIVVSAILIVGAIVAIAFELRSDKPQGSTSKAFYTDDDGQTYFTDSMYLFPPFDHGGKVAVRAVVFSYDKGKFIGYMTRYTTAAKKILNDASEKSKQVGGVSDSVQDILSSRDFALTQSEVKLPGPDKHWMPAARFSQVLVQSPDGSEYTPVNP